MTLAAMREDPEKDNIMVQSPPVKIGLDGDQVWQKFLASRIAKEREFRLYQSDGGIDTGFITGFDDVCVQLSVSRNDQGEFVDPRAVLIRTSSITKVEETGSRVQDLPHDIREKIRGFGYALRQHAVRSQPPEERAVRRSR